MGRFNRPVDIIFGRFGDAAPWLFCCRVYAVKSFAVTGILPDAVNEHFITNAIRHEASLYLAVLH
jgi:hypothetical protein